MKDQILKLAKEGNETELLVIIKGTRFYYDAIKEAAKYKHIHIVNKLFEQLSFNPYDSSTGLTVPQLALTNSALEGYSSGLHFEEVKQMVSLGGNIFYGLNGLVTENLLTADNALKLSECAKDEVQKSTLCDKIEKTYDINCNFVQGMSEIKDSTMRVNH